MFVVPHLAESETCMLYAPLFPLTFDVGSYDFRWSISSRQQVKTLTPKILFPQLFPYFRKLLFQQSTACTFISINKLTDLRLRMCLEQNVYMIVVMIPFLQCNMIVWSNIRKYFLCTIRYFIIKYFFSVFYHISRKSSGCEADI